ncbi:hypothetical protein ACFVOS_34240 [Streptomyces sp. NPDC057833]|uniref:hypothetical protein n=1 Tax=Streptomyces sp. NPDC057833 TaxID=3346258 RepID=UPI0036C88351
MRRPVVGEAFVHYGQIYVESDPESFGPDLLEAFAGQSAGLCGAAVPGALWLQTGLHTGDVGFTVEVHEQAPPLDALWEDVVEVSFRPLSADSRLVQWAGEAAWPLGLEERDYRVRYCAQGMDRAHRQDTRPDEVPQLDRYLLQFWPAPPGPDRVLKQTSAVAAYWHSFAREQPPPPTPAERAEAERRERLAREKAERESRLAFERWQWGGHTPTPALREAEGDVRGLRDFDPALLLAIDAAGPAVQRAVAVLAARRACEAAGLDGLDWVADGLTALAQGGELPPPFDDDARMWEALARDPRVPDRTVGRAVPPERPPFESPSAVPGDFTSCPRRVETAVVGPAGAFARASSSSPEPGHEGSGVPAASAASDAVIVTWGSFERLDPSLRMSQPHMALPAVPAAAGPDPLRAAAGAVYAAVTAYGENHRVLLDEIRSAVEGGPPLSTPESGVPAASGSPAPPARQGPR